MCFQCPFCSFVIKYVSQNKLGSEIICPNCGKSNVLPRNPYGPGRVIGGDFVIKHDVGVGSIGVVYEAWQVSLERPVALKILNSKYTNNKGISAFLYEARAAASLDHINIVKCFAVGEEKGICYMAMSFIVGETLKSRLKREGKFQPDEALHIIQQVAEALHYAWDTAKMIHRDIKPENIMIDKEGIVKVTDLGLALKQSDWDEDMEISGSPSYMSPEQFSGGQMDSRADIYSLGVTLYQLIANKLPFEAETMRSLARKHFREAPPQISKSDPNVPPAISGLIEKMMAKSPDDRFQSMEDLLNGIWLIRQKTAPDTDMIPGVHTITIKKLDYDLQKEALLRRKADHKRDTSRRELQSTAFMPKTTSSGLLVALTVLCLLLLAALIWVVISTSRVDSSVKAMEWGLRKIESKFEEKNLDLDAIEKECENTGLSLKSLNDSPATRELLARLNLCAAKIDKLRTEKEKARLASEIEKGRKAIDGTKKELESKIKENTLLASKISEIDATATKTESKLKETLEQELSKKKELTEKVKAKEVELKKAVNEVVDSDSYDSFSLKLYPLIKGGYGKKMNEIFDIYSKTLPQPARKWLAQKRPAFEQLQQVYSRIIENSNSSGIIGVEIDEGQILRSANGLFFIKPKQKTEPFGTRHATTDRQSDKTDAKDKDSGPTASAPSSSISEVKWDKLSVQSLFSIVNAKGTPPDDSPDSLKIKIALLTGELSQVGDLLKNNHSYDFLIDTIIANAVENVRIGALIDRKSTALKAQTLLKQYNGVPSFKPFEQDVKQLTSPDSTTAAPAPVELEVR